MSSLVSLYFHTDLFHRLNTALTFPRVSKYHMNYFLKFPLKKESRITGPNSSSVALGFLSKYLPLYVLPNRAFNKGKKIRKCNNSGEEILSEFIWLSERGRETE